MEASQFNTDAYSPKEVEQRIERVGVTKARLGLVELIALGVLAGAFIGFGALYYTIVASDPDLSFALSRMLGGLVFSLGLILVVVAGAELFTGNNLMVMAWVSGRVSTRLLLRNLVVVYVANFAGAAGLALLVYLSGHLSMNGGEVGAKAVAIAQAKADLDLTEAFFRGVLCNVLVCLAVWLAAAARSVAGKVLAILFPISAFVAAGFEHCVANMYFLPLGMLAAPDTAPVPIDALWTNLVPVTLGNIVGGAGLVGLVYWLVYHRNRETGS